MQDQIALIESLRDKAIAAYERAIALAEKHRKEAEEYSVALGVLSKIAPTAYIPTPRPRFYGGEAAEPALGPIYQRILELMRESSQVWWTANEIQEALAARGDEVKMTSISPNLSRLKENQDIVRDDLKVALKDRAHQKTEASKGHLLSGNPFEASIDTRTHQSGEPQAQGREAVPGGGP